MGENQNSKDLNILKLESKIVIYDQYDIDQDPNGYNSNLHDKNDFKQPPFAKKEDQAQASLEKSLESVLVLDPKPTHKNANYFCCCIKLLPSIKWYNLGSYYALMFVSFLNIHFSRSFMVFILKDPMYYNVPE